MNRDSARTLEFLYRRGLLSSADLEFGRPTVSETSISHRSCIVSVQGRPRWFVKSGDPVRSHGRDLGMESAVHRLAAAHPPLAGVIPRCRLIRADGNLLVMEAVSGEHVSPPLSLNGHADHGQEGALRAYGAAVGRVHLTAPPRFGGAPWMLSALLPQWGDYGWLPPHCGAFLRRLAVDGEIRAAFDRTRAQWRPGRLVHGDLRWANAIFEAAHSPPRVWLVDWELATSGDPAWDVGSVIADVAASNAFENRDPADWKRMLALCWPFLAAYHRAIRPTPQEWRGLLERSLRCAGIRLVQSVIEISHDSEPALFQAEQMLLPAIHAFLIEAAPPPDLIRGPDAFEARE
ncbi:MAG: aminoglycoside phosphotransferase family protein [Bryobacterales bacterium]|nr:aminoglycoside phosphotransferase family protein [Bryobacterales bacterium]